MFQNVTRWICWIAFLAGGGSVSAHSGFENETDVRIYADRMQVNVRTTYGFAWKILGSRAPRDIGEAGQKIAGPLLTDVAPGLFEVSGGGRAMAPRSGDCVFELDQHVMLRLVYDRPPAWPLVLKARFFDHFDPLTFGTVRVFDQTDAPFVRDVAPVAEDKIHRGRPVFTFDPAPVAEVAELAPAGPAQELARPKPQRDYGYPVAALLFGLLWWGRFRIFRPPVK